MQPSQPSRLPPNRIYVNSPQEAPPGVPLYYGPRGGLYYVPQPQEEVPVTPEGVLERLPKDLEPYKEVVSLWEEFSKKVYDFDRDNIRNLVETLWQETLRSGRLEYTEGDLRQALESVSEDMNLITVIKQKVVEELVHRAQGKLDEDFIVTCLKGWGSGKNEALAMVRAAASQLFGVPLDPTTKDYLTIYRSLLGMPKDEAISNTARLLEISYKWTQELLEAAGIKELVLTRGLGYSAGYMGSIPMPDENSLVLLTPSLGRYGIFGKIDTKAYVPYSISSYAGSLKRSLPFSASRASAMQVKGYDLVNLARDVNFLKDEYGDYLPYIQTTRPANLSIMIVARTPREKIASLCLTGFGCVPESELLVMGLPEDHVAFWATNTNHKEYLDASAVLPKAHGLLAMPGGKKLIEEHPSEHAFYYTSFTARNDVSYVLETPDEPPPLSFRLLFDQDTEDLSKEWRKNYRKLSKQWQARKEGDKIFDVISRGVEALVPYHRGSPIGKNGATQKLAFSNPVASALLSLLNRESEILYPTYASEERDKDDDLVDSLKLIAALGWDDLKKASRRIVRAAADSAALISLDFTFRQPFYISGLSTEAEALGWRKGSVGSFVLGRVKEETPWNPSELLRANPSLPVPVFYTFPYWGEADKDIELVGGSVYPDPFTLVVRDEDELPNIVFEDPDGKLYTYYHRIIVPVRGNEESFFAIPSLSEEVENVFFLPIRPLRNVRYAVAKVPAIIGMDRKIVKVDLANEQFPLGPDSIAFIRRGE